MYVQSLQCFHVFSVVMLLFLSYCFFRKVTSQHVGGEEILNDINSDIAETFGDTLQLPINEKCYCQKPLNRCRLNRPFSDWRCLLCFTKQSGRVTFECIGGDCVFKCHSAETYRVCPSCFEWSGTDTTSPQTDEKEDEMEVSFIHRHIHRSVTMISLVSLCFFAASHFRIEPPVGRKLNELENEKCTVGNFGDALVREASALNADVTVESLQKVVEFDDLSWSMIVDHRKQMVIEKLKAIEDLDEAQCNLLFLKMKEIRPIEPKKKKQEFIFSMIRILCEGWIMKCMYSPFQYFYRRRTYFWCVDMIRKVSGQDVGGEDILNGIKVDIAKIAGDALKLNMICYCQQLLSKCTEYFWSEHHCDLCQKSMGAKYNYITIFCCKNELCIYKRVSGQRFEICPSCHADGGYSTFNYTEDGRKTAVAFKLKSNISTMS